MQSFLLQIFSLLVGKRTKAVPDASQKRWVLSRDLNEKRGIPHVFQKAVPSIRSSMGGTINGPIHLMAATMEQRFCCHK